jgi:hypothetical protein
MKMLDAPGLDEHRRSCKACSPWSVCAEASSIAMAAMHDAGPFYVVDHRGFGWGVFASKAEAVTRRDYLRSTGRLAEVTSRCA